MFKLNVIVILSGIFLVGNLEGVRKPHDRNQIACENELLNKCPDGLSFEGAFPESSTETPAESSAELLSATPAKNTSRNGFICVIIYSQMYPDCYASAPKAPTDKYPICQVGERFKDQADPVRFAQKYSKHNGLRADTLECTCYTIHRGANASFKKTNQTTFAVMKKAKRPHIFVLTIETFAKNKTKYLKLTDYYEFTKKEINRLAEISYDLKEVREGTVLNEIVLV